MCLNLWLVPAGCEGHPAAGIHRLDVQQTGWVPRPTRGLAQPPVCCNVLPCWCVMPYLVLGLQCGRQTSLCVAQMFQTSAPWLPRFALLCCLGSMPAAKVPQYAARCQQGCCLLPRLGASCQTLTPACSHRSKQGATPAVLLERRKFGAVGWNIKYAFSDGDLGCSLEVVRGQLAETVST